MTMLCALLLACKPEAEKPTVVTTSVEEVTETTAKVVGQVTADGGAEVTERGVCWNTESNPEITDNRIVEGTGLGTFTAEVTDLEANTTYYVRAFATNEKGTSYGEEKSFTTKEIEEPSEPEEPGDDDDPEEPEIPVVITVTTYEITEITANSAVGGGNVAVEGETVIVSRGVCYGVNQNPTIEDGKTTDGEGIGAFTSNITELSQNTTYYVRAYAVDETGVFYGEEVSFTTLEEGGNTVEYETVDLGLPSGVKWATFNVGATVPEQYGDYFAWGETSPKGEYLEENSIAFNVAMEDISGDPQYDAATANWGDGWRMPTKEEIMELVDNCEWEWVQIKGVYGAKLIGPNGNSIFFPAAGYRGWSTLFDSGSAGYYWGSTPSSYDDKSSYGFHYYHENGFENMYGTNFYRYFGRTVRPVAE